MAESGFESLWNVEFLGLKNTKIGNGLRRRGRVRKKLKLAWAILKLKFESKIYSQHFYGSSGYDHLVVKLQSSRMEDSELLSLWYFYYIESEKQQNWKWVEKKQPCLEEIKISEGEFSVKIQV